MYIKTIHYHHETYVYLRWNIGGKKTYEVFTVDTWYPIIVFVVSSNFTLVLLGYERKEKKKKQTEESKFWNAIINTYTMRMHNITIWIFCTKNLRFRVRKSRGEKKLLMSRKTASIEIFSRIFFILRIICIFSIATVHLAPNAIRCFFFFLLTRGYLSGRVWKLKCATM